MRCNNRKLQPGSKVVYQNEVWVVDEIESPDSIVIRRSSDPMSPKISVTPSMIMEMANEGSTQVNFSRLNG